MRLVKVLTETTLFLTTFFVTLFFFFAGPFVRLYYYGFKYWDAMTAYGVVVLFKVYVLVLWIPNADVECEDWRIKLLLLLVLFPLLTRFWELLKVAFLNRFSSET